MWGVQLAFTRLLLSTIYFGATTRVLQDEDCVLEIPMGLPAIGIIDRVAWPASDFEFVPPAGTCGASFVNYGNNISCFALQDGVCRTAFPNTTAGTPPYLYIHIDGVGDDVAVSRTPFGAGPKLRRSLPTQIIDNGGAQLSVAMELEATRRCVNYPPTITDASNQLWTRFSEEGWCSDVLSAVYMSHRAVAPDTPTGSNATHYFFRANVGGGDLDMNTDFTYARLRPTLPPSRPPGKSDQVVVMAAVIPVAVVAVLSSVAFAIWKLKLCKPSQG